MPANPLVSPPLISDFNDSAITDMLGRPPGWLLHSGLSSLAAVVVIGLALAGTIGFPEKVDAAFVLQTRTVPLELRTGFSNYPREIVVADGAEVAAGDTLIVFRSDGDWRSLRQLSHWLAASPTMGSFPPERAYPAEIDRLTARLATTVAAYRSYATTNGVDAQVAAYRAEIVEARNLSGSLKRQVNLYEEELSYKEKGIARTRWLEERGVISAQDAELVEEDAVAARRQREVLVAGDIQNKLRVQQLEQEILKLRLIHREQLAEFDRRYGEERQLLETALATFQERFVLLAPETGRISWDPELRPEMLVGPNVPLGYLLPTNGDYQKLARLSLPASNQGKLEIGNKVVLNLDGYPSREYGQVNAELTAIAPVATPTGNGGFLRTATVLLPDTLRTSYGRVVPFQFNATGVARIITKDRTLLERMVDQFLNLSQNQ